jgi:hypothetical protein
MYGTLGDGNDTMIAGSDRTFMDGGSGQDLYIVSYNGGPSHAVVNDRDAGNMLALQGNCGATDLSRLPMTCDVAWRIEGGALVFDGPASGAIRFGDQVIEFKGIDRILVH